MERNGLPTRVHPAIWFSMSETEEPADQPGAVAEAVRVGEEMD